MDKDQLTQSEHLPYDPAYKKFFSDPRMVESLLRDFVTEDFVRDLDFSSMELMPTEYVHDDLSRGFSDVVWKIRWKNGSACYVVLVLEFQRAQDYLMALRIVAYTAELFLKLCRSGAIRQGELLPPVLPVVVYNGNGKWRANREVSEMFVEMPDNLAAYRPQQKYYLVDINEFPREMLEKLRTLVPLLFRLEKADTINDLLPTLKTMADIFKDHAGDALVQDFIT